MANIVAISNSRSIYLDLGIYANEPFNLKPKFVINKNNIQEVYVNNEGGIEMITHGRNSHTMYFSYNQMQPYNNNPKTPYLIVDSVNGDIPTDINHLLELIYNALD